MDIFFRLDLFPETCFQIRAGLPDGIFCVPKIPNREILEGLVMTNVCHLEYLRPFGKSYLF
jgi:hypothetical protein